MGLFAKLVQKLESKNLGVYCKITSKSKNMKKFGLVCKIGAKHEKWNFEEKKIYNKEKKRKPDLDKKW